MRLKWNRLLVIPLLIAIIGVWLLWPHGKPEAGWFDDGYGYRQKISFSHNAAISTERAVTFSLDTAEIIGNGAMQTDCDDVRFTDINGKLLKYQLTGTCNNAATTFEVVFPSVINGSNIGYVYYGNPSATSASQDVSAVTALTPSGGDPAITDVTNQETGTGPVLSWSMNEASGSTLNDDTLNANTGTLGTTSSAPTWISSDLCVNGSCLKFDGTNDYVSRTYSSDTELNPGTGSFSVSAWVKHTSIQAGTDVIISRVDGADANGVGYKIYMDSSGYICFGIDQTAGSFPVDSACSTSTQGSYADSKWHQVTGVKNGTTSVILYIDGQQIAADTSITASSISGSSPAFRVGIDNGAANPWDGIIDSVKVYPYARSADQVKTDFNSRGSVKGVGVQMGNSDVNKSLSNGLVSYWKHDESSGSSTTNTIGSYASGTLNSGTAWATGKYGSGLQFDGTDDDISLGTSTNLDFTQNMTLAAWIYPTGWGEANYGTILSRQSGSTVGYQFEISNNAGEQTLTMYNGFQSCSANTAAVSLNQWQYVAVVVSSNVATFYVNGVAVSSPCNYTLASNGAAAAYIGSWDGNSDTFKGTIDEVRAYNRALSTAELKSLYNWTPGTSVYYDLNEKAGTSTVYDKSGNGLSGSMSGGIIASAWVPGKFGSAIELDGANDYLNLSNSATNANINEYQGTISFWYKMNGGLGGVYRELLQLRRSDDNDAMELYLQSSTSNLRFEYSNSGSINRITTSAPTVGTWYHVAAVWRSDGTTELFVNGVSVGTTSSYSLIDTQINNFYIGADNGTDTDTPATFDDIKIYNYARTTAQIIEDMNGGHPVGGSPIGSQVGYWKFDEGNSTTAYDTSPNANDLTLSTATSAWTLSGMHGRAWDGNASRYVSRADDADFDFAAAEDFTLTTWIKTDGTASGTQYILNKSSATSQGYGIYGSSSGKVVFAIDDDTSWTPDDQAQSTTNIFDQAWHHIAARKTGTSKIDIFVDGRLEGSDTSLGATGSLSNAVSFYVGDRDGTDNGDEFNGDVDEVKIYRGALTDEQIKMDYNQGQSTVMGAKSTASNGTADNSASREYCVPGDTATCNPPILDFRFEEHAGQTVADIMNNGLFLYLGSGSGVESSDPEWTRGRHGSGLKFDGSDDNSFTNTYSAVLDGTGSYTVSAWINPATLNQPSNPYIIARTANNFWRMSMLDGGAIRHQGYGLSDNSLDTGNVLTANKWTHVSIVYDGTNKYIYIDGKVAAQEATTGTLSYQSRLAIFIGGVNGSGVFNGIIDDVRYYDYARTPAQIAWDYNNGGPAAWYRFDECQGTTSYDSSPNNNFSATGMNGAITIGATGSNTSAGTCTGAATEAWKNGVNGKIKSSLSLDGTNDYVSITDSTKSAFDFASGETMTISAWIKPSSLPIGGNTYSSILAKPGASGNGYYAQISYAGQLEFCIFSTVDGGCYTTTQTPVTTGTWQHVVYSMTVGDSSTIKMYYNGKRYTGNWVDNGSIVPDADNATVYIGATDTTGEFFIGQIDDVRIYRYALTDAQIKTVMNNNSAVNFAPITGSP